MYSEIFFSKFRINCNLHSEIEFCIFFSKGKFIITVLLFSAPTLLYSIKPMPVLVIAVCIVNLKKPLI